MKIVKLLVLNKSLFNGVNNEYDLYVRNNEKLHIFPLSFKNHFFTKKKYDYVMIQTNNLSELNSFYEVINKLKGKPKIIIISNNEDIKKFAYSNNYNYFNTQKFTEDEIVNNVFTLHGLESFNSKLCLNYIRGEFYHGI